MLSVLLCCIALSVDGGAGLTIRPHVTAPTDRSAASAAVCQGGGPTTQPRPECASRHVRRQTGTSGLSTALQQRAVCDSLAALTVPRRFKVRGGSSSRRARRRERGTGGADARVLCRLSRTHSDEVHQLHLPRHRIVACPFARARWAVPTASRRVAPRWRMGASESTGSDPHSLTDAPSRTSITLTPVTTVPSRNEPVRPG
jgi:hypothetical protein